MWKVFCFLWRVTYESFFLCFLRNNKADQKSLFSAERIELNKWKIMEKKILLSCVMKPREDTEMNIYPFICSFIPSILLHLQLWQRHCSNWGEEYTVDWSWTRGGIRAALRVGSERGFPGGNSVSTDKATGKGRICEGQGCLRKLTEIQRCHNLFR